MAITFNELTFGSEDTDNTTFTTASVSPAESVVLIAVMNFENSSTQPAIGSISGCGLTWTIVREQAVDASGTDRATVHLWKGLGTPSSGTITVTWAAGATIRRPSWIVFEVGGADTTTPFVQDNGTTSASAATTLTTTLAAFADATNNACLAVYGVQNSTASDYITPSTGHTEIDEAYVNYSHVGVSYQIGEDTSIAGTWNSGRCGQMAFEIAAGGASTQTVTCQLITASSTILSPIVINTQEIVFNVLNATSTIFSPTIINTQEIFFDVLATASTVFNPTLDYNVALSVLNTSSTLFNPTVVPGNAILTCDLLTTSSTVFNLTVVPGAVSIAFPLINATSTVLDPGSEMILQLDVTNTTSTILSPALEYNVALSVLNTSSVVSQPALMNNVDLQLLTTSSTVFSPTLNQDVNIPVVNATESVLTPQTQLAGAVTINYEVINTSSTLYAPTTKAYINVPVLSVPGTVESPSTKYEIGLQVVSTSSTIFTPSLEYLIELQTINTAPTVLSPSIGEPPPDTGQSGMVKTHSPSPFPIGI